MIGGVSVDPASHFWPFMAFTSQIGKVTSWRAPWLLLQVRTSRLWMPVRPHCFGMTNIRLWTCPSIPFLPPHHVLIESERMACSWGHFAAFSSRRRLDWGVLGDARVSSQDSETAFPLHVTTILPLSSSSYFSFILLKYIICAPPPCSLSYPILHLFFLTRIVIMRPWQRIWSLPALYWLSQVRYSAVLLLVSFVILLRVSISISISFTLHLRLTHFSFPLLIVVSLISSFPSSLLILRAW